MVSVFFSYSHADEALRDQLEIQLALLKRQGVITTWHDRRIGAGQEFGREIDRHVETDDIVLLLVSPDFLASDYCYEREMLAALRRHETGEAVIIPVILRACDWHGAPFGKLLATPRDGRPITQWPDRDQAMLEVARAVRAAAERLAPRAAQAAPAAAPASRPHEPTLAGAGPRSSNLRLAKRFTEQDKDRFRHDGFEFLARWFETSLAELSERNPGVEGAFLRIDANRFTVVVYRDGKAAARCTVFMGGDSPFSGGIAYVAKETLESNSYNETLRVEADDQAMFFRSMGMARLAWGADAEKLSFEGAAELYWALFIEPLQTR